MKVQAIKTRIFREGENLDKFILEYIPRLKEGSILVVTSKIVALSERRTAVVKGAKEKEKLVRSESELAIRTKYVWLTIKDGMIMANAGIDESNADGKLILFPRDSFKTAAALRTKLRKHHRLKKLGVLITDSRAFPLRAGVVGVAAGYAGFRAIKDYRGTPDMFGKPFRYSRVDIADGLATAAVLEMGEGREQRPLAIIEKAPVEFCETVDRNELKIDIKDDLYQPLFEKLPRKKL